MKLICTYVYFKSGPFNVYPMISHFFTQETLTTLSSVLQCYTRGEMIHLEKNETPLDKQSRFKIYIYICAQNKLKKAAETSKLIFHTEKFT
jgi:hypothetical protein